MPERSLTQTQRSKCCNTTKSAQHHQHELYKKANFRSNTTSAEESSLDYSSQHSYIGFTRRVCVCLLCKNIHQQRKWKCRIDPGGWRSTVGGELYVNLFPFFRGPFSMVMEWYAARCSGWFEAPTIQNITSEWIPKTMYLNEGNDRFWYATSAILETVRGIDATFSNHIDKALICFRLWKCKLLQYSFKFHIRERMSITKIPFASAFVYRWLGSCASVYVCVREFFWNSPIAEEAPFASFPTPHNGPHRFSRIETDDFVWFHLSTSISTQTQPPPPSPHKPLLPDAHNCCPVPEENQLAQGCVCMYMK